MRLIGVDGTPAPGSPRSPGGWPASWAACRCCTLDDIASHDELFEWTGRLLSQVIEPLRRGDTAHYAPYDWRARSFGAWRPLPPAPVVLVEGVGAGREALRPHLAHLLWMELPREEAWTGGRARD